MKARLTFGTDRWEEVEVLSGRQACQDAAILVGIFSGRDRQTREFSVDEKNPLCKWENDKYFVMVQWIGG